MSDDLVYAPGSDEGFVSLSNPTGTRVFKKHILTKGPLYYPGVKGGKVDIDDDFLDTVVRNFNDHVVSHVQTPVVDKNNAHSEDPFRNIGEAIRVEREGDKLYSYIEVRDEAAAPKVGKTLLGASAMLSLDWKNNKTNKRVGPALVHVAITNNAHLNDLEDFEEVITMSSVNDSSTHAVLLSATPTSKDAEMADLDTLIATLRDEHGIDVPALQLSASNAAKFETLSTQLKDKLTASEVLKLSNNDEETSAEDIVAAVAQLAEDRVELSNKVDALVADAATTKAEKRIDELVAGGFITPAKRDAHLKLLLSNPDSFEDILPEKPVVELSIQSGDEIKDITHDGDVDVEAEVARLSAFGKNNGLTIAV